MTQALDVRLENIIFSYGEAKFRYDALFPAGSITAIMGPSGSGKSTLLNLIAGFELPDEIKGKSQGRVLIGGCDVTKSDPSERPVSMIFQENNLFSHLTVEKNVALGRSPRLKLSEADHRDIALAIEATGLSGKNLRLPRELSGGERQRVALARVLVRDQPILLLDEPFASLGPALRYEMLDEIASLHRRQGMSVIFVTHHPDDAQHLAQNIVFLEDGLVAASGKADTFFGSEPPEAYRRYIGTVNARLPA